MEQLIDEKQIQNIFEVDPTGSLCQKLLTIFETEVSNLLYEFKRALHDQNALACAKLVHSIKSSSLNIGAQELAKKCEFIEKKFHEKKTQNEDVAIELETCFKYTVPTLREYILSLQK